MEMTSVLRRYFDSQVIDVEVVTDHDDCLEFIRDDQGHRACDSCWDRLNPDSGSEYSLDWYDEEELS